MTSRFAKIKRPRKQRGSAMIELAITLMGFLLMTIGTMEFGWAIYAWQMCITEAQNAARWASVRGSGAASADDVAAFVRAQSVGVNLNVSTTWSPNNSPGSEVLVTVTYNFVPMAWLAIQQSITFSSTADMVICHQPGQ
jgi:Flp pilus assembly protein TadG